MIKLFAYQAKAADTVLDSPRVRYNVFEAGLGKSAVALDVAKRMQVKRLLITCPLSVAYAWRHELAKFWPGSPIITVVRTSKDVLALTKDGVFIVSYSLLSRDGPILTALRAARKMDMTVIDEAHAVKSSKAKRTKALLAELRDRLGLAHPMSATPAPNHAGELWPILRSLRPDLIRNDEGKPMREAEFVARYCETKTITVTVRGRQRQQEIIVGSKNVEELRRRLEGFFLRETKANVLKDLPPLRFEPLPIAIEHPERFKSVGQLVEDGQYDEELLEAAAAVANATRYAELGLAKAPMVAEYVTDMLEGGVKQVVVWAVHHDVIDHLVLDLTEYGVSRLDGRVNIAMRAHAIDDFLAGRSRVFLGQIQAGGTGLTLTGGQLPCSDVVFAETSFSPGDNWQAACRIHRIGQHDAVLARFASAAGTYDDRIQDILARKARDFADLFEQGAEQHAYQA
jgi:SWI/SNF-related matrix-associated actin-dependent regulator 1 of chromatin subfamily A